MRLLIILKKYKGGNVHKHWVLKAALIYTVLTVGCAKLCLIIWGGMVSTSLLVGKKVKNVNAYLEINCSIKYTW